MSGHSHWSGIKHKKGTVDQKRGKVFSKLLTAISAAAKSEQNPDFNPRLRTAVQKAKEASVPAENIERAIKRASESGQNLEELTFEAYGPGGAAIIIEAISDNRNRTVAEVKKILNEAGGKWAGVGSVRWSFQYTDPHGPDTDKRGGWTPKFLQEINDDDKTNLKALIVVLEEHDDVQRVYCNVNF